MQKTKTIGITGGIGVGKSIICKIFQTLGIPVFNADYSAKYIIEKDPIIKKAIIELLGEKAFENGHYNRKYVAGLVFKEPAYLTKLNSIIHPKVREAGLNFALINNHADYLLYEAAIMEKAGSGNTFSQVIVVESPIDLRIKRIKNRDGRSEIEIKNIIENQTTDDIRHKIADYIITNDEKQSLIKQVTAIHNAIKS